MMDIPNPKPSLFEEEDQSRLPVSLYDLLDYRSPTEEDIHFIKKSWLTSLRLALPRALDSEVFYNNHEKLIGNVARAWPAVIACDKEQPFFIYAWMFGGLIQEPVPFMNPDIRFIIHYTFVRPQYRRVGLAKAMAKQLGWKPGSPIGASHITGFIRQTWHTKLQWNPYLLGKYNG